MDILKQLCAEFSTTEKHTQNVINLLDEGNTVPFIARYRKELTGNMDDQLIRSVSSRLNMLRAIEEKKVIMASRALIPSSGAPEACALLPKNSTCKWAAPIDFSPIPDTSIG